MSANAVSSNNPGTPPPAGGSGRHAGRSAVAQAVSPAAQYVTIGVGNEVFAVDVANVREVLDLCPFTRVPNMPEFVRGMIDVRGTGVPVIDLRAKLGLPPAEPTLHSRIVVLEVDVGGSLLLIGALADRVYEVLEIAGGEIDMPPQIGVRWRSDFIRGIGRRGHEFVIILELGRLFATEEAALLTAQV